MHLLSSRALILAFTLPLLPAARAQAPAAPKPPVVTDPALKIELVATLPEIEAPTTVCGDPSGAVYVGNDPRDGRLSTKEPVCTIVRLGGVVTPPGRAPSGPRTRTVFADKLYSPAGSAWHDGFLYVLHDPLLTRFKDTDGDGLADVREDLVTNLGIPPNEGLNDHVVSGFTLGMDGFFYISVGDRGIFQAKSVRDGSTITMQGGGIARCRTDGTQLEVFSTGTRNHLQVNLDAEDNAFTRDNTDDGNGWWTRLTHHIEGGYYGYPYDYRSAPNYGVTQPSQQTLDAIKQHGGSVDLEATTSDGRKVGALFPNLDAPKPQKNETFLPAMADFGPGSPTGGLCYLSDGLPEQYRGRHFFSDWGKQGVFVTEVARDGATFKLVSDTKLIEPEKGADFRPMQLSVAADGSLLIADWGYGGWKSPKVAGAIWRLSWPEAKPAPRLAEESKAGVEELLAALGHPDRDQRLRAQAALASGRVGVAPAEPGILPGGVSGTEPGVPAKDRSGETPKPAGGTPTLPERLTTLINAKDRPALQRIHALWTLRAVGDRRGLIMTTTTFLNGDPEMRVQALRTLVRSSTVKYLADADPRVRLQAAISQGRKSSEPGSAADHMRMETLVAMLPKETDPWVRFAFIAALRRQNDWAGAERWLTDYGPARESAVWRAIDGVYVDYALQALAKLSAQDKDVERRAMAVAALGRIAYQPVPYDGHWWGTQPVKSPAPLNSVPWAGTPQALPALTAALSDREAGVRLAAATAFSGFILTDFTAGTAGVNKNAQLIDAGAAASETQVDKKRPEGPPTGAVTPPTGAATPPTGAATPPTGAATPPTGAVTSPPGAGAPPTGPSTSPTASAGLPGPSAPSRSVWDGVEASRAALRSRLTAETDRSVRRQLIEALGVQKDPQAMDVFRQIALDEKADAEFRETAIGAVVNIGGDGAKKVIAQLADAKLSPAATRKVIIAAGELKVLEAAPALIAHLRDENPGNREFSARALQQLGPKANAAAPAAAPESSEVKIVIGSGAPQITEQRPPSAPATGEPKNGTGPNVPPATSPASGPATAALIAALADKDGKVQAAAIDALGSFKDKAALPALIGLAEKKRAMKETVGALANMPDASAIPVLVETLREKNTGVRRSAIKALKTMREKAAPQVEALLASGRVPDELVAEIKSAFESGAIVQWKMVGVFENVWDAVHPPEKDVLALRAVTTENPAGNTQIHPVPGALEAVLAKKYHNAEGKDVGWIDVTADSGDGRVDLGKLFKSSAMVCAYALTEIDAPEAIDAKLFTSADDEIAVWLNGQRVLNQPGNHGYDPDKNETPLALAAGKNSLFVKIGNKGGTWLFHARIPGLENGKLLKPKDAPPEEKQKLFALAAKPDGTFVNAGTAKNGERLFFDTAAALGGICATCHAVGAKGGQIGPALTTVGANYKRADLITSIHEPSKTIALGYEQVMLETAGGETVAGSLRAESAEAFTIADAAGQTRTVKKAEVKKKTDLHVSLMPPGLTLSLKPEEFTDLLAYLEALKGQ